MTPDEVEHQEVELVLAAIAGRRGYDFRGYAMSSLRRRLRLQMSAYNMRHMSELIPRIVHDEEFFSELLVGLSVTVTSMFRDPQVFRAFREHVVPVLRSYPLLKIWHAGCATGQEAYSTAILLHEEGLLDRTQIYATDVNERSLLVAKRGIYAQEDIDSYEAHYRAAGGTAALSDYFHCRYGAAGVLDVLKERILFSTHNLVTDGVFGEMNVVFCRNVLIYFEKDLQNRVLSLFRDSLVPRGYLCLGTQETLYFTKVEDHFRTAHGTDEEHKLYRLGRSLRGAA